MQKKDIENKKHVPEKQGNTLHKRIQWVQTRGQCAFLKDRLHLTVLPAAKSCTHVPMGQ